MPAAQCPRPTGIRPGQAGATTGLMRTMEQAGGALGLSVLVTVYGSAGRGSGGSGRRDATAEGLSAGLPAAAAFIAAAVRVRVLPSRASVGET